ncbi:MAG: DUF1983 domain-containing protein, partial [Gammaproteobacteria bacterium]|nr:DUF1983 domain-containing protein [Gammaproteobacteria bacterium]
AIEGFFLSWGAPKYLGHAITRIYRTPTAHTDGTPDENPAFSEAFFVGTTMGNQYSDKQNITGGEGYTYWIRFSNLAGEYGPLSSSEGTFAVAGYDPAKLLEILTDRIDSSHLTQTLRGDITLITAEGGILEDYPILKEALGETVDDYINNNQTITQRISATESIVDTSSTQINTVAEGLIDSALQLDLANNKISTYLNDLNSFVDATFTVDPDSGSIELDAVNALRTETGTTFSQVTARFDAMDTTISLNATKADLSDYVSKLGTAGIDISGETPLVSIHASKIITEHGKPLDTKLSEAGIDVSGETGSINLSASSVNVDYAGSATNLATALNELYTAANAAIDLDGVTGVVSITAMNSAFSVIAPVWDEATTYGVGDPVIHNFKHWQATNPQTGTPPNTDRWLDLGTITGRFNSAENNINTAQNTANQALTGLTNKADSSTVGAIEDKQKIITADLEAVTETSRNQQSELWLSATTAIETALQNDANSNTVLASFSRFQDDVKTVASENEALAERTQLVEAELPGIKTRISDYRVASIKEHEASVTLITEAEARIDGKAQVAYSNITDAFVSADGVIAGRAETLEGAVFEDDGTTVRAEALFEDVVSMNIDSNSALASNFTSLSTSLGTKLAASTHNEFVLSFSDENSAVAAKIKDYHVTYRGASATMQEIAEAVVKETDSVAWSHYDHTLTHNLAAAKLTHDLGEVPEAGGDQDYTIEMQVIGNAANILVQTNVLKNVVFTLGGKTSSGEPEIIPDGNGAYWVTHVVKNVSPLVLATNSNLIVGRLVGCGSRIVKLNVTTQAIGSTHALWAVKQSVGDLKAGFGLYNNGSMTEFTVVADQFSVVNASGNGATAPFVIITNHSDPDVPDGVYIDEAFMNKATITELIANTVTADYVNAIDFHAISISGGTINIANAFTVGSNGGVIAKNITIMNDNNEVLLSSNTNRIAYSMISGGPPATADKTNYSDSRVNNNNVNYNNLFNRPSIPSSIADIDGDGVINKLENNIAMAGSEALAHQVYETYYSHITNSQGGVTGQYVGDSSYKYVDFYLPSAGMVSVFVRGASLGVGQRVEIRNTNSNSWTLMGTIPNLDMEYR